MEPMRASGTTAGYQPGHRHRLISIHERSARSSYVAIPGSEMPAAVYVSVFAAFMWVLVASWVAFAREGDADLLLGVAVVLAVVFFALPLLIHRTAKSRAEVEREARGDFLSSPVHTATGPLTGSSAWLQVVLIPASLALAATLIGITALVVH